MAIDNANWHYGGDGFPEDLPPEAGGTHIGMFLAWAIINHLESEMQRETSPRRSGCCPRETDDRVHLSVQGMRTRGYGILI